MYKYRQEGVLEGERENFRKKKKKKKMKLVRNNFIVK